MRKFCSPLVVGLWLDCSDDMIPLRPGIPLSLKAPSFTDARFTMEAWYHERRAMTDISIHISWDLMYFQVLLYRKADEIEDIWRCWFGNRRNLISPVDDLRIWILWELKQEAPQTVPNCLKWILPPSGESMAGGHHRGQLWSGHLAGCCDQGQGPNGQFGMSELKGVSAPKWIFNHRVNLNKSSLLNRERERERKRKWQNELISFPRDLALISFFSLGQGSPSVTWVTLRTITMTSCQIASLGSLEFTVFLGHGSDGFWAGHWTSEAAGWWSMITPGSFVFTHIYIELYRII